MTFICGPALANLREEHRHEYVSEITARCMGRDGTITRPPHGGTLAPPRPVSGPHAAAPTRPDAPTDNQIDYVRRLNGDVTYAIKLTRKACSEYISSLEENAGQRLAQKSLGITEFIKLIGDGYYATRKDANEPYRFFRVSRPTRGKFNGALKIQTRHAEDWKLRFVLWPSGKEWVFDESIKDNLLVLVADQDEAKLAYAEELGACFVCNTTLTDERSRWYGIGPDCEKRHRHVIATSDDLYGPYAPGRLHPRKSR